MKKITFLLALLITTVGFSQTTIEDFEGTAPTLNSFDGFGSNMVTANPTVPSEKSLELITSTTSAGWQGAGLNFQNGDGLDLSGGTKTVTIAVYSTVATDILAKVTQGGTASATDASHGGTGWEDLDFDFSAVRDGTAAADAVYTDIIFYPAWNNLGGTCTTGCYTGSTGSSTPAMTIYIDDIRGIVSAGDTCANGVQDGDETGVDCGGSCPNACDPEPSGAAPVPTTGNATVYSIYNDTNGYTTAFNVQYPFGTATEIDLDATSAVNNAFKMNLNADGFGQGEGGPDDVSSYDFVNFNYWFSNTTGTAGFTLIMIDNDGAVQEFGYQVGSVGAGDAADVVEGAWTTVSIPMSYFTNLGFDSTNLFQWKVDRYNQSGDNGGFLFLDNIVLTQNFPLSRDEFSKFEASIYPNPSSNGWTISTPNNTIKSVQLFNVLGKQVVSKSFDNNEVTIANQSMASGIYLARITTDAGTKTVKLIKE